jgi:hypothetical protein
MSGNSIGGNGIEPEADTLRAGLHAEADIFTVSRPPIAAVRRRAGKRRTWRWTLQGLSGAAVTCAVIAGIAVWTPGRDAASGPTPWSSGAAPARTAQPTPTTTSGPSTSAPPTGSTSGYLLSSDLGTGWTGPVGSPSIRTELTVAGSACQNANVYQPQVPVTPAWSNTYDEHSASGKQTNVLFEAVYTFAPGTGTGVLDKVRAALGTGCGSPASIKLLASLPAIGDEAIVYTAGGDSRNILVRIGDRLASAVVNIVPSGQDGTGWIDHVAQQMAARLAAG